MDSSFLQRLAQSFITRTNAANGNTAAAQAAQAAGEGSLLRRAQAAHTLASIPTPQEDAAKLDLTRAQAEQARGHAQAYRTPKPASVGDAIPVMDEQGNTLGFIGKRPGSDGNLPHWDNQGRPVGTMSPDILKSAIPSGQPAISADSTAGAAPASTLPASTSVPAQPATQSATFPATYRTKPKPAPKAGAKPPQGRLAPLVDDKGNVVATFNNVTGQVSPVSGTVPGQPAAVGETPVRKSPMTAQDRITGSLATSVRANIDKMAEIADNNKDLTTGPIAGRISQAYQRVAGPDGPEGDFDFYGNAAVDLVYAKSGKQINEHEMQILRQMIPNRNRGNLKHQVELFDHYANTLLAKYGAPEPQVSSPSPNPSPSASHSGFKVIGVRP